MDKGLVETLLESLILEASPGIRPEEDISLMYKDAEWFQKTKGPFIKNVLASMNPSLDKMLNSILADIDKKRPGVMGTAGNLFNKFGSWWKQWFGGRHENSLAIYSKINDFVINEISRAEKRALPALQPQSSQSKSNQYQNQSTPQNWTPNPYSLKDSLIQFKIELNRELEKIISAQYDALWGAYLKWQSEKEKLKQRRIGLSSFATAATPGKGKRLINRAAQVRSPEPETVPPETTNAEIEDLEARNKRIEKIAGDHDVEPEKVVKSDEDTMKELIANIKKLIAKSDKTDEEHDTLMSDIQATVSLGSQQGEFTALNDLIDKEAKDEKEESLMWDLINQVKDSANLPEDLKTKIQSHINPFSDPDF